MEPVVAPLVSQISLRLRYLVGMVRESVVDAAAVDIEILAVVFHAYA